jgi:hypothetical protein
VTYNLEVSAGLEMRATMGNGRRSMKSKVVREETKDGEEAGTFALVERMTDRINGVYKERVTLASGKIVKDVHGALSDQSLHGPPK